jgi:hypothetical protein
MATTNQRKFDRYELVNKRANFVQGDQSTENVLLNISRGGVYFVSETEIEPGTRLVFEVNDRIRPEIEIIRNEPITERIYLKHGTFKVGSGFVDGPLDQERLYEILEVLLG